MLAAHLNFNLTLDTFLDHLSRAAYQSVMEQGFAGNAKQLYQDLQRGLQRVITHDMFMTDQCGLFTVCEEATRFEPWSEAAKAAEQEMSH